MMSRFILEMIKQEVRDPETPEFVLMNREDVLFLLEIIDVAEDLAKFTNYYSKIGLKPARKIMQEWDFLLAHEV